MSTGGLGAHLSVTENLLRQILDKNTDPVPGMSWDELEHYINETWMASEKKESRAHQEPIELYILILACDQILRRYLPPGEPAMLSTHRQILSPEQLIAIRTNCLKRWGLTLGPIMFCYHNDFLEKTVLEAPLKLKHLQGTSQLSVELRTANRELPKLLIPQHFQELERFLGPKLRQMLEHLPPLIEHVHREWKSLILRLDRPDQERVQEVLAILVIAVTGRTAQFLDRRNNYLPKWMNHWYG